MPRIAKADVNKALTLVAKATIEAGGADGRTSRAEMKAKLAEMPKAQRALADSFFKFVDARDFKSGAQVTAKDVNKAVSYAKTHMVEKYDLNNNGLSRDEVSRMSLTGRRAVDLAKALKAAAEPEGKLNAAKLGTEIAKFSGDALYMSEGDYNPEYFAVPFSATKDLTPKNVMSAMNGPLAKFFSEQETPLSDCTIEGYSARDSKEFIDDLSRVSGDNTADDRASAAAFGHITDLMKANLTDIKVFKVGPKDVDGTLAEDSGLYAQVVVGRTADGKLAGIILGDVET